MIDFKDYLIQEYIRDVNGYKAVEFKFSYSLKTKCMKDCLKSTNNNIIRVYIRFVDESLKTLLTDSITFENNTLTKSTINKLKNISGKELINKFNKAKSEIIASIINEHQQKVKELNDLIINLRTYQGGFNNVIPNQYQGECIQLNEPIINEPIKKTSFEM